MCYEACLRRASCEKRRTQKANLLELAALEAALRRYVVPFLHNPEEIHLPTLRGLVTQVMQINNLSRLADLSKLRACDVSRVRLRGVPALCIQYRSMKNDQSYRQVLFFVSLFYYCWKKFCNYSFDLLKWICCIQCYAGRKEWTLLLLF